MYCKSLYSFVVFFVIFILFSACKPRIKDSESIRKDFDALMDSISDLVIKGDSISLEKALVLCDSTLIITSDIKSSNDVLRAKIMVLSSQGRKKEAFSLQDKVINKDPDSIDRLIYNGVAELNKEHYVRSKAYFEKAIAYCEKELALKPNEVNTFVSKIGVYVFLNDRDKADSEIQNWLLLHPEDELVLTLRENLDNMFIQAAANIHQMQQED